VATIERLIPGEIRPDDATGQATLQLHVERYEFAAKYIKAGRLLDIACGVGYGTSLLAGRASGVVEALGVDLDADAVGYAGAHYASERTRFLQQDAMTFADGSGFDSIVSVETLEHVPDPGRLVHQLLGLLRPGGVFVASVPTTPSIDVNPYHRTDFTEESFRRLVTRNGLTELGYLRQTQPYPLLRVLRRTEPRMQDMRRNLVAWYARHPRALGRRLLATVRYGFNNRYLTVAWQSRA